jgi:hypothetical protein
MARTAEIATDPQQIQQLEAAGYFKCPNPICSYYLSPEEQEQAGGDGDLYKSFTCPGCRKSYNLNERAPFSQADKGTIFEPGGHTSVGLTTKELGDMGEDIVKAQGEIPGYGPILWWHEGQYGLDGGVKDWAIEVKTIASIAKNHRFIPGDAREKVLINQQARDLKPPYGPVKGILGVLVIIDFARSVADIYGYEMPLIPYTMGNGKVCPGGLCSYRKHNGITFLEEVPLPFENPFLAPDHPAPRPEVDTIPF